MSYLCKIAPLFLTNFELEKNFSTSAYAPTRETNETRFRSSTYEIANTPAKIFTPEVVILANFFFRENGFIISNNGAGGAFLRKQKTYGSPLYLLPPLPPPPPPLPVRNTRKEIFVFQNWHLAVLTCKLTRPGDTKYAPVESIFRKNARTPRHHPPERLSKSKDTYF